jgi:hypothetical protein
MNFDLNFVCGASDAAPTERSPRVHAQGDWRQLVDAIANEDRMAVWHYNAVTSTEFRLQVELGPMPCFGAIDTAPVVLLIAHPVFHPGSTLHDHSFRRSGWPLAALHPDAPSGARRWWHERLEHLIVAFGARAVANAVAAVPLTPWSSTRFDRDLRLPSRKRLLSLAASAARRGALMVTTREPALWTEAPDIAGLPRRQNVVPRSWRARIDPVSLGSDAWSLMCRQIEAHLRGGDVTP